jgi:hypothetical protein
MPAKGRWVAGPRLQSTPYFKDLPGFYTSDGKNFVSGKQKRAIFEFLRIQKHDSDFTN